MKQSLVSLYSTLRAFGLSPIAAFRLAKFSTVNRYRINLNALN